MMMAMELAIKAMKIINFKETDSSRQVHRLVSPLPVVRWQSPPALQAPPRPVAAHRRCGHFT